jgi:hypothetical protein
VILCGLCVEGFSEFNIEDTEKSHREHGGGNGERKELPMERGNSTSLRRESSLGRPDMHSHLADTFDAGVHYIARLDGCYALGRAGQ